jgi:hypothetical protein
MRKSWIGIVTLAMALGCSEGTPASHESARYRRIPARVTGEPYAPRRVLRGPRPEFEDPEPLPTEPHARGRALLQQAALPSAIDELRVAARGGDPEALSDLAAALVTTAERSDRGPVSAVEAISVARQALAEEPDLAAAHFNIGLALEQLGLLDDARTELLEAARLDGGSEWAAEARERADRLREQRDEVGRPEYARIARYVELTADPAARAVLRPYFSAEERLREGARRAVDASSRLPSRPTPSATTPVRRRAGSSTASRLSAPRAIRVSRLTHSPELLPLPVEKRKRRGGSVRSTTRCAARAGRRDWPRRSRWSRD